MTAQSPLVSVIVPVYQNAASLPLLAGRIDAVEQRLLADGVRIELVFVDDGSTDGSGAGLDAIKLRRPGTKIVRLTRNFGAVHASRTGMSFVDGDAFVVLAADLQDPPELLVEMVARWRKGSRFVIAVRSSRDDPWASRLASRLYYVVLRALVLPGYPEGGFDMALMDRQLLPPMRDASKNAFTPLLAYWLGFKPDLVRYHRPAREFGRSGWSFRKKTKAFLDVMLGFSVTPIRMISAVGATVASASFAYGTLVGIGALMGRIQVSGFATIAILLTFLLGLVIVMLGVIGEYLWRIFDEINRRPEAVVDRVD